MHKPILTLLICILCVPAISAQKKLPKNKSLMKQSVDLPKLIDKIKAKHIERKGNEVYKAIILYGPLHKPIKH